MDISRLGEYISKLCGCLSKFGGCIYRRLGEYISKLGGCIPKLDGCIYRRLDKGNIKGSEKDLLLTEGSIRALTESPEKGLLFTEGLIKGKPKARRGGCYLPKAQQWSASLDQNIHFDGCWTYRVYTALFLFCTHAVNVNVLL